MLQQLKNSKFYIGITLMVQAVTFAVLFLVFLTKKRSLSATFLALAAVSAIAGKYLLDQDLAENPFTIDDDFDCDDDIPSADDISVEEVTDIPADDTANEDEFKDH